MAHNIQQTGLRVVVQKVGELEIVQVDSTTSIAILKGLDKRIRKQGEGLQPLDRVISPKRPPSGRRNPL